ncbi:hypothetical protein N494_18655 (plasmid) [Clostridium botulinum A2B7 92]|uniref:hypothetical protein n=1 Tax=Clostridium botulinum TaxID=1491 RepID=UPI0007DF3EC1|nr:hypothetical protein [Clostridium botulinum]KEI94136.1 hypothetical protein N494_18655 [Clostridium botulinum A2B7 92]
MAESVPTLLLLLITTGTNELLFLVDFSYFESLVLLVFGVFLFLLIVSSFLDLEKEFDLKLLFVFDLFEFPFIEELLGVLTELLELGLILSLDFPLFPEEKELDLKLLFVLLVVEELLDLELIVVLDGFDELLVEKELDLKPLLELDRLELDLKLLELDLEELLLLPEEKELEEGLEEKELDLKLLLCDPPLA